MKFYYVLCPTLSPSSLKKPAEWHQNSHRGLSRHPYVRGNRLHRWRNTFRFYTQEGKESWSYSAFERRMRIYRSLSTSLEKNLYKML